MSTSHSPCWAARACLGGLLAALAGCTLHDPNAPGMLVPATVDDDPTLPAVDLPGTRLHVRTYGDPARPPLFVLEGGPGTDFRYMLPLLDTVDGRSLTDDWFVVFHDYRGSGLSRRHGLDGLSLGHLRRDTENLIAALGGDRPVVLLGHSHGGIVAAQLLETMPERIRGLVLVEPGELSSAILRDQPDLVDVDYFGEGVHDIAWLRELVSTGDHETADYAVAIARESLDQGQRGDAASTRQPGWRRGAASLLAIPLGQMEEERYDFTDQLRGLDLPVLFISSDGSEDLGFDFQQDRQVPLFDNAEHVLVSGTGHSGLIEAEAPRTLRHVFDFLDGLEP